LPILFIIAGMTLATIKVFYDGSPRLMTPEIFPTSRLIYNKNPPRGGDSTAFI
jgi:hypothetical protein